MTPLPPRILVGCGVAAVACLTAFRVGDRPARMAAGLVAACLGLTTFAEWITDLRAEPVVCGDIVCGLGLLLLASSFNAAWLWTMTGIEAALFMLHAWFYGFSETPSAKLVIANNLLATLGLIVLVIGAVRSRKQANPTEDAASAIL